MNMSAGDLSALQGLNTLKEGLFQRNPLGVATKHDGGVDVVCAVSPPSLVFCVSCSELTSKTSMAKTVVQL